MTTDAFMLIERITAHRKYMYWGEVIEGRKGLAISYSWYLAVKSSLSPADVLTEPHNENCSAWTLFGWWTYLGFVKNKLVLNLIWR